jgi:hypothetical protein
MLKDFSITFADAAGTVKRADAPFTEAAETIVETFMPEASSGRRAPNSGVGFRSRFSSVYDFPGCS